VIDLLLREVAEVAVRPLPRSVTDLVREHRDEQLVVFLVLAEQLEAERDLPLAVDARVAALGELDREERLGRSERLGDLLLREVELLQRLLQRRVAAAIDQLRLFLPEQQLAERAGVGSVNPRRAASLRRDRRLDLRADFHWQISTNNCGTA